MTGQRPSLGEGIEGTTNTVGVAVRSAWEGLDDLPTGMVTTGGTALAFLLVMMAWAVHKRVWPSKSFKGAAAVFTVFCASAVGVASCTHDDIVESRGGTPASRDHVAPITVKPAALPPVTPGADDIRTNRILWDTPRVRPN